MSHSATAHVRYTGQLHTTCTHQRSGASLHTDAPPDNRGKGENYSPTDLVATASLACLFTVLGIRRGDKGLSEVPLQGEVTKHMAANPRRIAQLDYRVYVPQGHSVSELRAQLEEAMVNCPVHSSLSREISIRLEVIPGE